VKGPLAVGAAVVVALSAIGISYWAFFVRGERESTTATPRATAPAAVTLTLSELVPPVEIAGADGKFHPARLGDTLAPPMRIRTGDAGSAVLRAADGSTVKLLGGTTARVESLSRELERLSLGEGMVEADVRDDPGRLVQLDLDEPGAAPGASPAARTRGAAFVASTDGSGRSAVATRRGEVILSARGKEVIVHTGEYARVGPGERPGAPSPIPGSLFLKVAWPSASRVRTVVVAGETQPGARVAVQGRFVRVAPDGKYRAEVSLDEGTHQLAVDATDVAGRTKRERSPPILIDTSTDFQAHPPDWRHKGN